MFSFAHVWIILRACTSQPTSQAHPSRPAISVLLFKSAPLVWYPLKSWLQRALRTFSDLWTVKTAEARAHIPEGNRRWGWPPFESCFSVLTVLKEVEKPHAQRPFHSHVDQYDTYVDQDNTHVDQYNTHVDHWAVRHPCGSVRHPCGSVRHPCGSVCQSASMGWSCWKLNRNLEAAPRLMCQMLQNTVQAKRYVHSDIVDGSIGPVSELVQVQLMISSCLDSELKHFHQWPGGQSRSWSIMGAWSIVERGTAPATCWLINQ